MPVSWDEPSRTATISGTMQATTDDIVTAIADPTYGSLVHSHGNINIYTLRDVRVSIENHSAWIERYTEATDEIVWLYHEYNRGNEVVEFQGPKSTFEWGHLVIDDDDEPVAVRGHHYWFLTKNPADTWHWSVTGTIPSDGVFRFYGGMFEIISTVLFDAGSITISAGDTIVGDDSGATALVTVVNLETGTWGGGDAAGYICLAKIEGKFQDNEKLRVGGTASALTASDLITPEIWGPNDECEFIQAQVTRFGGFRFTGVNNRVLETNFKKSQNKGLSFHDTNTALLRKLRLMKCRTALTLYGSGVGTIRELSLRANTFDISAEDFSGKLYLIDSTDIQSIEGGTLDFDGPSTLTFVLEQTSYNLKVVNPAGVAMEGFRTQAYRKATEDLYGAEDITDSSGLVDEMIVNRHQYDTLHPSTASVLDYGNFGIRVRKYGYNFIDLEKIPEEEPMTDILVVTTNPFTLGGTNPTSASTITGIDIDMTGQTITITESHSLEELYSYLQYQGCGQGTLSAAEFLSTRNGVAYAMASNWTMVGVKDYIDLQGCYIIKGDGSSRFVDIYITNIVAGARVSIRRTSDNVQIGSGVSTGTSIKIVCDWPGSEIGISVRVRLQGYVPFNLQTTLPGIGLDVGAYFPVDPAYGG